MAPHTVWHAFLLFFNCPWYCNVVFYVASDDHYAIKGCQCLQRKQNNPKILAPLGNQRPPQQCFGQNRHLKFTHFDEPLLKVRTWYELLVFCMCKRILLTRTYVVCFAFLISSYFLVHIIYPSNSTIWCNYTSQGTSIVFILKCLFSVCLHYFTLSICFSQLNGQHKCQISRKYKV